MRKSRDVELPRRSGKSASSGDGRDLAEARSAGDDGAFEPLIEHCRSICLRQARRVLGNRHASWSHDAAQEALLEVFLHLTTWKGTNRRSFSAWVRTIAARAALRFRQRIDHWSAEQERAVREVQASLRNHAQKEADRKVEEVIEALTVGLSHRQKLVLQGRLAGMPEREIAEAIGLTRKTVRNDMQAIRGRLERILGFFEK